MPKPALPWLRLSRLKKPKVNLPEVRSSLWLFASMGSPLSDFGRPLDLPLSLLSLNGLDCACFKFIESYLAGDLDSKFRF